MKQIFFRGKVAELKSGVEPTEYSEECGLPVKKLEKQISYWLIIYPECDGIRSGLGLAFLRKTWGYKKLHDEEKEKSSRVWEWTPGYKVISHHKHSTHSKAPCPISMDRCGVIELEPFPKLMFIPPLERLPNQEQICDHEPPSKSLESGLDPCHVITQSRTRAGKSRSGEPLSQFHNPSVGDQIKRMRGAGIEQKIRD